MPIQVFLFGALLESFLIAFCATKLYKIPIKAKQLILISIIHALAIWGIRSNFVFPKLAYGIHTGISILVMAILLTLIARIHILISFSVSFATMLFVIMGDFLIVRTTVKFVLPSIPLSELPQHPLKYLILGYINDSILILFAILCLVFKNFHFFPAPGIEENEKQ